MSRKGSCLLEHILKGVYIKWNRVMQRWYIKWREMTLSAYSIYNDSFPLNSQPFLVLKRSHRSLSLSSLIITNICQLFSNSIFHVPLNSLVVVGFQFSRVLCKKQTRGTDSNFYICMCIWKTPGIMMGLAWVHIDLYF